MHGFQKCMAGVRGGGTVLDREGECKIGQAHRF